MTEERYDPTDDEVDMTDSGSLDQPRPAHYTLTVTEGRTPTPDEWRVAKHTTVLMHALGGVVAAVQRGWDVKWN